MKKLSAIVNVTAKVSISRRSYYTFLTRMGFCSRKVMSISTIATTRHSTITNPSFFFEIKAIGRFLSMQYKVGINQNTNNIASLDFAPVNTAVIGNETTNSATKPIPVALTLLLPFIINMGVPCSSLSKLTSVFLLTRYGMPKSVTTPIIPLIGCLSINAAEVKPRNIPSQNIRFQKLSLFIREAMKPVFGWFGILSSNCLTSFLSLKGFVKSCISNTDYQFYILGIILSGNRLVFKEITSINPCYLSLVLYSVTICNFLTTLGNYYES